MRNDNFDDNFENNFDDEEENLPDPKKLPIYQKGFEIFRLCHTISDLIDDQDPVLAHLKGFLLEDAALLSVKVAGAVGGGLYDLKMENAALIRKAARDLLTHCRSLEIHGFVETHYLQLIREAIEAYRLLFIEWIKTFDPWEYVYDDWELFNPPGAKREPEI